MQCPNLVSTLELFREFYRKADQNPELLPGFESNLANEADEKLSQIIYVLGRIDTLSTKLLSPSDSLEKLAVLSPYEMRQLLLNSRDIEIEIKILVETFYYFSWRLAVALGTLTNRERFAGSKIEGIRDVRNHLIEHPEKKPSRVLIRSFGLGGEFGPVVKAVRYNDHFKFMDKGLYRNAEEFKVAVETLLRSFL